MARQCAFFGHTTLQRSADLAGPQAPSKRESRNWADTLALGGMRRPDLSIQHHPQYTVHGKRMRDALDSVIHSFPEVLQLIKDIRDGQAVQGFSNDVLWHTKARLLAALDSWAQPAGDGPDDILIEAFGKATGDVDAAKWLPLWLREGAPMGISRDIPTCGVFPAAVLAATADPDSLVSQLAGWANYESAETQPDVVWELLQIQRDRKHCLFFDSHQDALDFLQTDSLVLSKLALISKERDDGTWKHRLIWDLRRSKVNDTATLGERLVLPRIQDAVDDAVHVCLSTGHECEWLVLDIEDAFHNIPLHLSERKFACAKLGDTFIIFLVLCMGGKAPPTLWGRFAALQGRFISCAIDPDRARAEVYVDDPLLVAAGTQKQRNRNFAVMALALAALGFPLSWSKAQLGSSAVWIGAKFSFNRAGIQVAVPERKLLDITNQISEFNERNLLGKRAVVSFCGKVSFLAGFIIMLRPFLTMVWGAVYAKESTLPDHLLHRRKIQVPLDWLRALLQNVFGPLVRTFEWHVQWQPSGSYIATDASPWGFAGVLFKDHRPIAWYACKLSQHDLRRFRAKVGESGFTTTWEALALLVAFRVWLPSAKGLARVRSDSLGALRAMVKLASRSPALNLVAREMALDAVLGLYSIGLATHIPGVSNVLPDHLSRLWAPDAHVFPQELANVPETLVPPRDTSFWKTATKTPRGGAVAHDRKKAAEKRQSLSPHLGPTDVHGSSNAGRKTPAPT